MVAFSLRFTKLLQRTASILVAAGQQRIQRQRVSVRHGALLLGEYAEHTGFKQGEDGEGGGHDFLGQLIQKLF